MQKIRIVLLLCIAYFSIACVTARNSIVTEATPQQPDIAPRGTPGTRTKQQLPAARIALVIGNGAYTESAMALPNPINDARAMATILEKLGFKVRRVENANLTVMRQAIESFNGALKQNTAGVGLFYFAGHGVRAESGLNYLIPVDFKSEHKSAIAAHSIDADSVRQGMEQSHSALNIAILDACRNSLATRNLNSTLLARGVGGIDPGLPARGVGGIDPGQSIQATTTEPKGFLVALATGPGSVSFDGEGANGMYTSFLLKYIATPGMSVEDMFKQVGADVAQQTGNQQRPWYHSSIQGDFTFVPVGTAPPQILPPGPIPRAVTIDFAMFKDTGSADPVQLQNGATLQSDDGYFFHTQTGNSEKNYIYVYDIDSAGKMFRLFPNSEYHTTTNPIPANTKLTLPNAQEVYVLDNTVGKEDFYFVVSSSPVPKLETLENGTVDDIMQPGFTLRGTKNTRIKNVGVTTHAGTTTQVQAQELEFSDTSVHTLTINHQ